MSIEDDIPLRICVDLSERMAATGRDPEHVRLFDVPADLRKSIKDVPHIHIEPYRSTQFTWVWLLDANGEVINWASIIHRARNAKVSQDVIVFLDKRAAFIAALYREVLGPGKTILWVSIHDRMEFSRQQLWWVRLSEFMLAHEHTPRGDIRLDLTRITNRDDLIKTFRYKCGLTPEDLVCLDPDQENVRV